MNYRKIKISVFIITFAVLLIVFYLIDYSKQINYYNLDPAINDTITVKIHILKNPVAEHKKISLYYNFYTNEKSSFTDSLQIKSEILNQTALFNFYSDDIPNLYRISFDKTIKETLTIDQISIIINDKEIEINPKIFINHPSIDLIKNNSKLLSLDLSPKKKVKYDPYIYTKEPVNISILTISQKLLILLIIAIISFLISKLFEFFISYKFSMSNLNPILIFLLIISLLFKEHWVSKVFILITIYTLYLFTKNKPKLKGRYFKTYFYFFLWAAMSLIWSVNVGRSLDKLSMLLPFLIIPFWITSLSKKIEYDKIFKNAGNVFLFVSLVSFFLASIRFQTTNQTSEFFYHTLSSPLSTSAIYLSLLYLFVLYFNLFFFVRNKEKSHLLISAFLFIYILFLSSKMIIIIMIVSIPIIVSKNIEYHIKYKKRILYLSILSFASILLFIILTNNNISKRFKEISNIERIKKVFVLNEFGDTYEWNGLDLRLFQFRCFLDIEKKEDFSLLLGVGLHNAQQLLNERYRYYKLYIGKKWENNGGYLSYNFHNQYTQTLIELGLIGFAFLIFIYFSLINYGLKTNNFLLLTIIFTFIFIMFTESILVRQKGVVMFVLFPLMAIKIKEYLVKSTD